MSRHDGAHRTGLVDSMATFYGYQWIFLRALFRAVSERFGTEGLSILKKGFRRYGYYRGQYLRDRPETFAEGRDALSLVRNWDTGDYALAALHAAFEVQGSAARVTVTFPCVPGTDYFYSRDGGEVLELFWHNFLAGIAEGYDEATGVEYTDISLDPHAPWQLTWTYSGAPEDVQPTPFEDVFTQPAQVIQLTRRTIGVFAALQMYVTRELIQAFDASGEKAVREASYTFGAERGSAIREQHLKEGVPINFKSFFGGLQERDPVESIFVYRGERHISPGIFQVDCTYCPLAEVWAEEGGNGIALGYMFDMENHRGLVESYHPGAVVRWDAVKSRGDNTCKFRFLIPELVTASDPDWAQPKEHKKDS